MGRIWTQAFNLKSLLFYSYVLKTAHVHSCITKLKDKELIPQHVKVFSQIVKETLNT